MDLASQSTISGRLDISHFQPIVARAPHPLKRQRIKEQMLTGVRAIDVFVSCGRGQRLGIFAGSGVGKSVLLGMIARRSAATVNVIALIGERGREVREFIERDLGPEGLSRSVVVAVTSDEPSLMKIKGAMTATAIAEYFRNQGHDVILMLDSITRIAMRSAKSVWQSVNRRRPKGYTPSVYAMLPKLLERAGAAERGIDHRSLYDSGGRRRFQRTDFGSGALDSRWPCHTVARTGAPQALSRD